MEPEAIAADLGNGHTAYSGEQSMNLASLEPLPTPIQVEVLSSTPGRVRLRVSPEQREPEIMAQIARSLQEFFSQVYEVRTNPQTGSMTVFYEGDRGDFEAAIARLGSLGVLAIAEGVVKKSPVSKVLMKAMGAANARVESATKGSVDLRFLVPFILGVFALRQLISKGPHPRVAPWYALAWYAFDSFMKLNVDKGKSSSSGDRSDKK